MAKLRGVLLDVDGTLVDSNDAHARAWVDVLAEHGIHVPFEEVRRLIGMGGDKLLPRVSNIKEDSPEGQQIAKRRREIFKTRYLPSLVAFPGAKELLEEMRRRGLKLVVASSATREELTPLLRVCGADKLVDEQTSSDDADESKPDPDIVKAALERGKLSAAEAIMLGDTPYDVAAATGAGVKIIAFRCGGWDDADLAGAIAIYDGPADLLAHYDSSPLGSGRA